MGEWKASAGREDKKGKKITKRCKKLKASSREYQKGRSAA
jgi:hypothetical protein